MRSYLDNSATTKQYKEVSEKMIYAMENLYGNPSSLHKLGFESSKAIKKARMTISEITGFPSKGIIFTGSGSEATNIAIRGVAKSKKRNSRTLVTSLIEHPATIETFKDLEKENWNIIYLPVNSEGLIDTSSLMGILQKEDVAIVSIMHVNNEVGTISPIKEIGEIICEYNREVPKEKKVYFHVDAVQSFCKIKIPIENVDLVSISAHKIHGPKGIGALLMKDNVKLPPILTGGGQEFGLRPGTENITGIIGFEEACLISSKHNHEKATSICETLATSIYNEISDIKINGEFFTDKNKWVGHILNVSFIGVRAEVLLHLLEEDEIYVSTGSACSSNKNNKSHVLKAMNLRDNEIEGAIRFSVGDFNELEEIPYVIESLKKHVNRIRKLKKLR